MISKIKLSVFASILSLGFLSPNILWAQGEDEIEHMPQVPSNPVMTHVQGAPKDTNIANDGSVSYSYPILLPPGRGSVDPSLSISYNSNNRSNGPLGVGFSLGLPAIERSTKRGIDWTSKKFVMGGQEIVRRPDWHCSVGTAYGARIESSFTKYCYSSQGGWTATTREGIRYFYGKNEDSRQMSGNKVLKWHLYKVEDTLGNFTKYNYERKLLANGDESERLYLDSITYTHSRDNGGDAMFEVHFYYKPSGDPTISYKTHVPVKNEWLLNRIAVFVKLCEVGSTGGGTHCSENAGDLSFENANRLYELHYGDKIDTMSFLSSVVATEEGDTKRSTTEFTWKEPTTSLPRGDDGSLPIERDYKILWFDYNGDAIDDVFIFYLSSNIQQVASNSEFPIGDPIDHPSILSIRRGLGRNQFEEVYVGEVDDFFGKSFQLHQDNKWPIEVVSFDHNGDNLDDLIFWSPAIKDTPVGDQFLIFESQGDPESSGSSGRPLFKYIYNLNSHATSEIQQELTSDYTVLMNTLPNFTYQEGGSGNEGDGGQQDPLEYPYAPPLKYSVPFGSDLPLTAYTKFVKHASTTAVIPFDFNGDGNQDLLVFNGYGEDMAEDILDTWDSPPESFQGQDCQVWHDLYHMTHDQKQRSITIIESNGKGTFKAIRGDWLGESVDKSTDPNNDWWNDGGMPFYRDELQVLDFNGDGYDDFVVTKIPTAGGAGGNGNPEEIVDTITMYVFESNGDGSFELVPPDGIKQEFGPTTVVDPAHANAGESLFNLCGSHYWGYNDGVSNFVQHFYGKLANDSFMTILDYNGDGNSDILVGSPFERWRPERREFRLLRSNGTGVFNRIWAKNGFRFTEDTDDVIYKVFPVDYNSDGKTDLASFFSGIVAISRGDGEFEKMTIPRDSSKYAESYLNSRTVNTYGSGTSQLYWSSAYHVWERVVDSFGNTVSLKVEEHASHDFEYAQYLEIPHLLEKITTTHGDNVGIPVSDPTPYHKQIAIDYTPSSELPHNAGLPHVVPLVTSLEVRHGTGVQRDPSITSYDYLKGYYSVRDREFRGFGTMIKTLPDLTRVVEKYETRNYYTKGKILSRHIYSSDYDPGTDDAYGFKKVEYSWGVEPVWETADDGIEYTAAFVRLGATSDPCVGNDDNFCTSQPTGYAVRTTVVDFHGDIPVQDTGGDSDSSHTYTTIVNYTYDMRNGLVTQETNSLLEGGPAAVTTKTTEYSNVKGTGDRDIWRATRVEVMGTDAWGEGLPNPQARKTTNIYKTDGTGLLQSNQAYFGPGENDYAETKYTYDNWNNIETIEDPMGRVTTMEYDTLLHAYPTRVTRPQTSVAHVVQSFDFDYKYGKALETTDENGNPTITELDTLGRTKQVHQPNFPAGVFTEYEYNDELFPRSMVVRLPTNGSETIDTWTYLDGGGNTLQTITNAETKNGVRRYTSTINEYDVMGRNFQTYGPYHTTLAEYYGDNSGAWDETDRTLRSSLSEYDYMGRVEKITLSNDFGSPRISEISYRGLSRRTTDADGGYKDTISDHLGRVLEVIEFNDDLRFGTVLPHSTYYNYNPAGDLLSIRSYDPQTEALQEISYEYDLRGQKTYMSDPDMGEWSYEYYPDGTLRYVEDGKGSEIEHEYDALARMVRKVTTDASGNPSDELVFEYDICQDSDGNDLDAEVSNCIGKLSQSQSLSWYDEGQSLVEETSTQIHGYNEIGLTTSQTKRIEGLEVSGMQLKNTTSMEYDLAGKPTRMVYPNGLDVVTTYHPGTTLVHEVREAGSSVSYAVLENYDPTGKIGDQYHGFYGHDNYATKTEYLYGPATARLTTLRTFQGSSPYVEPPGCTPDSDGYYECIGGAVDNNEGLLQYKSYQYSDAGDIETIHNLDVNRIYNYEYDSLHRLIGESEITGTLVSGQLKDNIVNSYDKSDLARGSNPHGVSRTDNFRTGSVTEYTYDANGNLTKQLTVGGWGYPKEQDINYNVENMPKEIITSLYTHDGLATVFQNITSFAYSASGKRVAKHLYNEGYVDSNNYMSTYYVSEAYEVLDGFIYGDIPTRRERSYIFAGNLRVAKVTDWITSGNFPAQKVQYFHKDHLGSTTVVTDALGRIRDDEPRPTLYRPFGTARPGSRISYETDYAFTDQEYDHTTGFYNYDARLYNPEIGMFVTADTLIQNAYDPQFLNRYAYVRNNPMIYVDPSGHKSIQQYSVWLNHFWPRLDQGCSGDCTTENGIGECQFPDEIIQGELPSEAPEDLPSEAPGVKGGFPVLPFPEIAVLKESILRFFGELFRFDEMDAAILSAGGSVAIAEPTFIGEIGWAGLLGGMVLRKSPKAMATALKFARTCFPAGTLIWTADGLVAIEDIDPGDIVLCANMDSGEWVYCEVEDTLAHDYNGLMVSLKIDGETIEATGNHPFWVGAGVDLHQRPIAEDTGEVGESDYGYGRWVAAKDIHVGDWITILGGAVAEIDSVEYKHVELPVFNLQVDQFSTYAVGEDAVLVHNKKSLSTVWNKLKTYRGKIRTNGLKGKKRRFYEWDHTHSDIEVYDSNRKHLGSMDAGTGRMTKPAVPGRKIKL